MRKGWPPLKRRRPCKDAYMREVGNLSPRRVSALPEFMECQGRYDLISGRRLQGRLRSLLARKNGGRPQGCGRIWPNRIWPKPHLAKKIRIWPGRFRDRIWPNRIWPNRIWPEFVFQSVDRIWPNRIWPILVF